MSEVKAGEVYKHYKNRKYLVLGVAFPSGTSDFIAEGEAFAIWVSYDLLRGTRLVATPVALYDGQGVTKLIDADYTGRSGDVRGILLVAYVGLYDNPKGNRVCLRPIDEWSEVVGLGADGAPAKRFERIKP